MSTSVEECARRDVKGLYARQRRGKLTGLTGVDDPYEPPADPELVIQTEDESVDESVATVLAYLAASSPPAIPASGPEIDPHHTLGRLADLDEPRPGQRPPFAVDVQFLD